MVIKDLCILVIWMKVASALKGLIGMEREPLNYLNWDEERNRVLERGEYPASQLLLVYK